MVIRETKGSMVLFIPECTCNKKLNYIKWKASRYDSKVLDDGLKWAEDHEELHELSRKIVDFIADTGKMQKEDIMDAFPDYKEEQLSIAANMSMYPIVFPKKRHAPLIEFEQLKQRAIQLTEEYRRIKYATTDEAEEDEPSLVKE